MRFTVALDTGPRATARSRESVATGSQQVRAMAFSLRRFTPRRIGAFFTSGFLDVGPQPIVSHKQPSPSPVQEDVTVELPNNGNHRFLRQEMRTYSRLSNLPPELQLLRPRLAWAESGLTECFLMQPGSRVLFWARPKQYWQLRKAPRVRKFERVSYILKLNARAQHGQVMLYLGTLGRLSLTHKLTINMN